MRGMWFIRGNLIRDLAALNKVELLPWDGWGLIDQELENISQGELILLDEIATITSDEIDFLAVRELYKTNQSLEVPPIIKSYSKSGTIEIDLETEEIIK